ncbi:MAG: lipoyl synthase [Bacillota bacterium]
MRKTENYIRKPNWLNNSIKPTQIYHNVGDILLKYNLNTVCEAASCPNRKECYNYSTATFMLMGKNCSRNCAFCNVTNAPPQPLDPKEPENIAKAIKDLEIKHAVITSVTRDDLKDGGAVHFANTINSVKEFNPKTTVEVLIPDFQGDIDSLKTVIDAKPDIINHNVETIPRLYTCVRPQAIFERSLELLQRVKQLSDIPSKTGFMVGLGETKSEVYELLRTLREVDCDMLTIGQYLQPSLKHFKVKEYIHPDIFKEYYDFAMKEGFSYVVSAPLARSSYMAHNGLKK